MSYATELSLSTRCAYRLMQKCWKPIVRHASSKHFRPDSKAFMNIGGVSHFNGDSEVDKLARGFLNETVQSDEQRSTRICTLKGEAIQEVHGEYASEEPEEKMDLTDVDSKSMDALINKCALAVAELEKFLSTKATEPLNERDLNEVQDALEMAGFNVKDVEQSKITFRGDIKIVTPHRQKSPSQAETDASSFSSTMENETIYTYKAFPTIEVPLTSPDKESDSKEAFNPNRYDVSNDELETEQNQQTKMQSVLDDTKSRILMRYALLKALYVLESGGTNCKAKVVFSNPRKS